MADPIDVAVGIRIRSRRRELKLSQTALADHLGLTFQQVQKYERGANRVSASMLVHIAERLDCSVASLIGETADGVATPKSELLDILYKPGAVDLLKAYGAIATSSQRLALVKLAEGMSEGDDDAGEAE